MVILVIKERKKFNNFCKTLFYYWPRCSESSMQWKWSLQVSGLQFRYFKKIFYQNAHPQQIVFCMKPLLWFVNIEMRFLCFARVSLAPRTVQGGKLVIKNNPRFNRKFSYEYSVYPFEPQTENFSNCHLGGVEKGFQIKFLLRKRGKERKNKDDGKREKTRLRHAKSRQLGIH